MTLLEERDVARLARDARAWLIADERRKVIGMVLLSVTVSITLSLLMTAIVGTVTRRRAAAKAARPESEVAPAELAGDVAAGVAVMDVAAPETGPEAPVEA
jgi:hypothetical protein